MNDINGSPEYGYFYETLGPYEYFGLLELINDQRAEELKEIVYMGLEPDDIRKLETTSNIAVVVVGSDGKKERHAQSDTEMVVVCNDVNREDDALIDRIRHSIKSRAAVFRIETGIDGFPHVYDMSQLTPICYVDGKPGAPYIDYLLNSRRIAGNIGLHAEARKRVLEEAIANSETGDYIREKIKQQRGEYRNTCNTGIFRKNLHFDIAAGLVVYNESHNVSGFKPVLRAVQRQLDILTVQGISSGLFAIDEYVENCKTDTLSRLSWVGKRLPSEFIYDLQESYTWFLQQYHKSQEIYGNNNLIDVATFSIPQFVMHRSVVLEFLNIRY
jgi:hypothetical protein